MRILLSLLMIAGCSPATYDERIQHISDLFYGSCSGLGVTQCKSVTYELSSEISKPADCTKTDHHIRIQPSVAASAWVTTAVLHELGHCSLGREHVNSDCISLMAPVASPKLMHDTAGRCTGDEFRDALLRELITDDLCYASVLCDVWNND